MSHWNASLNRDPKSKEFNYIEICTCSHQQKFLRFYANKKEYIGECGCSSNYPCAKLQINKHQIEILSKKKKFLEPYFDYKKKNPRNLKSPYDHTLDKFFGE